VIRRVSRDCVPVALNVDKVSAAKGPNGDFFRAVQKQRPRQSQGVYLVSPDGKVLSGHDRAPKDPRDWPQALLDAIDEGLRKFGPVTPRPARRAAFLPHRGVGVRPDGGIVLAAYTSFLLLGLDRRGFGSVVYDSVPVTKDNFQTAIELLHQGRRQRTERLIDGVSIHGREREAGDDGVAGESGGLSFRGGQIDEQTGGIARHGQVAGDLGHQERTDDPGVSVRLHHDGGPPLAPKTGRVGKADEDHVAPAHGFSGRRSYSSMSSQPIPLPVSQARASSSSRVHGLSSYSFAVRR
jgi:hypothetical protein